MIVYLLPILAVCIGFAIAYFLKRSQLTSIKLLLAFSGAYLLSLTVFEFFPEVYTHDNKQVGLFIMIGILLQILLEFLSKGAEHGHIHHHEDQKSFPFVLFISLSIHSLLEGFPLHDHDTLLYGVVIHKVPIAIILSTFLLKANFSKVRITLFLILFALMTPLGSLLQAKVAYFSTIAVYINALVIGIFLHVSTTILFETGNNHKFNATKLVAIILGIGIAYLL
jgi:zinc transporter ZupT